MDTDDARQPADYPLRRHLTVLDVMTTDVVTALASDSFKAVAQRMYTTGVSSLPVVDDDRLVIGVVSEADLLVKESGDVQTSLLHPRRSRVETGKAAAMTAAAAMSSPAIVTHATATVRMAARLMHSCGVKHLPVVDESGRLLGVVSRHDVIRVFSRSDEAIHQEVIEGVFKRDVMIDTMGVGITVEDGVVSLFGEIERRSMVPVVGHLVAGIDGVVGVSNVLTYRWDDTDVEYTGEVPRGIAGMG